MVHMTTKELLYVSGMSFFLQVVPTQYSYESTPYPTDLESLLTEFSHVFSTPTSLPPLRAHDHRITLRPNQELISVRPYRC